MTDLDLFGPVPAHNTNGAKSTPIPSGYAQQPGTGPQGETCGTCKHCQRVVLAKVIYKCAANRARWSHGRKTDILKRAPACRLWEARP